MATSFPTGLDALTNPTSANGLNSPDHAGQHADANDAIEALEAKVGINSSAVTTSHDYLIKNNTPAGVINMWATATAPTSWLLCDGSAVSRTTYPILFSVIGTTYGSGNGTTTFNVPDLKGKVAVGKAASGTFLNLGALGGAETVTLSATESGVASHTHVNTLTNGAHSHPNTLTDPGHFHSWTESIAFYQVVLSSSLLTVTSTGYYPTTINTDTKTTGITINNASATVSINNAAATATSAASAHNNLQPYIVLNYIIKT